MRKAPLSPRFGLVLAGALAAPLGCQETPEPVVPTTPTVTAAVAGPAPGAQVDLSPVADPADLFVVARWKNPNATLTGVGSCAGLPAALVETNAKLLINKALANAFRGGVDGKQIADIVALDAPVDLVVSLDAGKRGQPDALFAFSIGLVSVERAKGAMEAAGPLVELLPGLWRVGVKDAGDLTCVIGPAAGNAPARLICGQHDKDVAALGPYLARNLPVAPPPTTDVHAEFRFTPIEARYGSDIRRGLGILPSLAHSQTIGEPHYDRALEEGAAALADEAAALATDLDRVTLDLGVDGTSCLTATTALQLRGKSSWIAGAIAERSSKSGPPPAIFWRAPLDSDSASYGRASDSTRYHGMLRVLRGLLEGKLAKEQIGSDADRKALAALITIPLGKDTNMVIASGHVRDAVKPATAAAKPSEQQLAEELANSYLGWYLLGFDEGPAALSKMLKDVVSVYGRKALTDPLRKLIGRDADALPVARFVAAPAQLGKGALDLELAFTFPASKKADPDAKKKKPAGINLVVHVLLMGDGQSTWIAVGANRDELVRRMLASKGGAPDAGTIAARPGLEPLRSGKAVSSGFITLAMFTRGIASIVSNPNLHRQTAGAGGYLTDIANTLNNMPHKGETPIFVTSTASSAGPRGELVINMQKGSFEDMGTILMSGLRIANNAGLLHP